MFGKSLERYKADELFDSLADHGDPFPVMSALEPDAQNLPLRMCVGDMSTEYCKYHYDEEAFCSKLAKCMELEMEPQVCRPEVCPFLARGCKVASACMQKSVLDEYKKEFAKTTATTNAAMAGASAGAAAAAAAAQGGKVHYLPIFSSLRLLPPFCSIKLSPLLFPVFTYPCPDTSRRWLQWQSTCTSVVLQQPNIK